MLENITIRLSNSRAKSIISFFTEGHERTLNIKKNIAASFLFRAVTMLIGFIQVPITLHYLNPTNYGIWITLGSIINWFYFLDIGLGNGLRNKLAEAVAKGDAKLAKAYISTTYAMLGIVIVIMYGIFLIINPLLSWASILNTPEALADEISLIVFLVFTTFCLGFFLQLIRTIIIAYQKPAIADLMTVAGSALTLAAIVILSKTTENGSLLYLSICFSMIPVLVYFGASIISFFGKFRQLIPSFKTIDLKYAKELTTLGIKFFALQISALILYSTDNLIITQVLGPSEVTPYSIAFKYFNIVTVLFMIIAFPFWSGFTEAFNKQDFDWIRRSMKKLIFIVGGFISVAVLMIIISNIFYSFWIGDEIKVPFLLSLFMGFYVIMMTWGTPFVYFINGVGKIKLQLIMGTAAAILNIPLSIFFAKNLNLGSSGVILATIVCNSPAIFLWPAQYKLIMAEKATGIWNK